MKSSSVFQHIFTAIFLLCLWPILTLAYIISSDISFTILSYNHSKDNFYQQAQEKLTKGEKVRGSFRAEENNLGIVSVRFTFSQRVPYRVEDELVFRIKEQGSNRWYYENKYRAGIIYDVPFFPFGFAQIENSKGKVYEFEIESLKGNDLNALAISPREPILASKYQISKAEIMQDKSKLAIFIGKKLINNFSSLDGFFISIVFLLPFIFYILLLINRGTKVGKKFFSVINLFGVKSKDFIKSAAIIITLSLIGINIVFLQLTDSLMYIALTILWFIAVVISNNKSSISYLCGLVLLITSPLLFYFNSIFLAEYVASWAFLFLFVGLILSLLETKKGTIKLK